MIGQEEENGVDPILEVKIVIEEDDGERKDPQHQALLSLPREAQVGNEDVEGVMKEVVDGSDRALEVVDVERKQSHGSEFLNGFHLRLKPLPMNVV